MTGYTYVYLTYTKVISGPASAQKESQ